MGIYAANNNSQRENTIRGLFVVLPGIAGYTDHSLFAKLMSQTMIW